MNRTPLTHILILTAFLVNIFGPLPSVRADELLLPVPGTLMQTSPNFRPPLIQGLKIDTQNPFHLQFIMEEGQGPLRDEESLRSLRYFLTALTVPEKDIWVNLSPREKNKIVPSILANTEMGVDLLGQDYLLKQLASSLLYPEGMEGKEFWRRVYARAQQELGTTNVPLNVVNKVWITPGEILVQEKGNTAIIDKAGLEVMVESDYLALKANGTNTASVLNEHQALMNDVYRKIVIPELTREVNQGSYFSRVRQIYHALILAYWYKHHFHQGALAVAYVDLKKTAGVSVEDKGLYGKIYAMYLKAYKKGAFNYVREEPDAWGAVTARKYFSGGFDAAQMGRRFKSGSLGPSSVPQFAGQLRTMDVRLDRAQTAESYIVDKGKKENLPQMGNKGRNLQDNEEILKGHIPAFEILSARLYGDYRSGKVDLQEVARVLRDRFAELLEHGGTLVVRPSSTINMPGILPTDKKVRTADEIVQAISKIYKSWETPEAQSYLETQEAGEMFDDLVKTNIFNSKEDAKRTGPAIVIQKEVLGDMNKQSGSGVFISRNTKTGKFMVSGSFGVKTAPEDIRNGVWGLFLKSISPKLDELFPSFQRGDGTGFYAVLQDMADKLERHYGYPVEVEFIVENGKLYVVQVNQQDIPARMRGVIKTLMADEGRILRSTIVFSDRDSLRAIGQIKPDVHVEMAAQGLGLSLGAAEGYLSFSLDKAKQLHSQGRAVIYVSTDNTDSNKPGFLQLLVSNQIDGLITFYGDYHMHTARIARENYIPAISLANQGVNLIGQKEKILVIGDRRLKEGDRVVINTTEENEAGNGVTHIGQLMLPRQEDPVVEKVDQVPVGNLYFDVEQLKDQITKQYKATDYQVLTATHALLKAYLQKNIVKGLEANKLEVATGAIHLILTQKFKSQGADGSREDVYMPIARGFGGEFSFPDIQTIADIPKAVELMDALVQRYKQMSPDSVNYLNYPAQMPIIVPLDGDIPLEFSILFKNGDINWQDENPQLWAFVRGVDIAFTLSNKFKKNMIPAELVPDPVAPEKIRVVGKLNVQRLPEVQEAGEADIKIGVFDAVLQQRFFGLPNGYHLQIKDFKEYLHHKISQIVQKDYPLSDRRAPQPMENYSISPNYASWQEMATIVNNEGRKIWENGGFLWRPFRQRSSHTGETRSTLNPSAFWANESEFLVQVIRQLFPGINVTHHTTLFSDVPSTMQAHNTPTLYVDTYASYIIFDKDAVGKLRGGIAALAQRDDLSGMIIKDGREEKLDLEAVILRLFIDRFGKEALVKMAADQAQVGGIDLDLSGRKIGSSAQGGEFFPWTKEPIDHIKGLIPVIVGQRNISTIMEFIQS